MVSYLMVTYDFKTIINTSNIPLKPTLMLPSYSHITVVQMQYALMWLSASAAYLKIYKKELRFWTDRADKQ